MARLVRTKVKTNQKVIAISHALMAEARPGSLLSPIQLGLGITMHHSFQSSYVVDVLSPYEFMSSYTSVMNYEKSAAISQSRLIPDISSSFCQWIADNVDDNPDTLHGKDTVHAMGITSQGILCIIIPPSMTNFIGWQFTRVLSSATSQDCFSWDLLSAGSRNFSDWNNRGV